MRTTYTAALVSLVCTILNASCIQVPPETSGADDTGSGAGTEATGEAAQPAYEDTFHFVVDVKDDGEGKGGGWQKATAKLSFIIWTHPIPQFFKCPITVGVPIRTAARGRISPEYAARITAEIATKVTDSLTHSRDWAGESELYCRELYALMQGIFRGSPYQIPATVARL